MQVRCAAIIASLILLSACGAYDHEAHRRTRSRAEFDTFCTKGVIPWRVFYEGSDSAFHNFIVNDMDMWSEMRIPRDQILITDIRPAPTSEKAQWYYCVDPCDDWIRPDTCWLPTRHIHRARR